MVHLNLRKTTVFQAADTPYFLISFGVLHLIRSLTSVLIFLTNTLLFHHEEYDCFVDGTASIVIVQIQGLPASKCRPVYCYRAYYLVVKSALDSRTGSAVVSCISGVMVVPCDCRPHRHDLLYFPNVCTIISLFPVKSSQTTILLPTTYVTRNKPKSTTLILYFSTLLHEHESGATDSCDTIKHQAQKIYNKDTP